jgi:hypothetical protein
MQGDNLAMTLARERSPKAPPNRSGVAMPDPVTLAIASAVAGKVAESLTDQARQALTELRARIRRKFLHRPEDLAILEAAQADPSSSGRIAQVASLIERTALDDPAFGNDIRSLWNQVQIEINTTNSAITNVFHGQADKVVQTRDVHGDLTIN